MNRQILQAENLQRTYETPYGLVPVLQGASFSLQQGEMVALVGPSGAGKSTLLQMCGLLDAPTAGNLLLLGKNVGTLSEQERTLTRRTQVGFVYQFHHLLPEFSALENVMLPQFIAGQSVADARAWAETLLNQVGLGARLQHRPAQLSGGEQQRVAICRALANKPQLLIADEPTGNLDPETGGNIFQLFRNLAQKTGVTTLMATHNMDLARQADRVLTLSGGKII